MIEEIRTLSDLMISNRAPWPIDEMIHDSAIFNVFLALNKAYSQDYVNGCQ